MTNKIRVAFIGQKGIPTQQGGIEKHVEELSAHLAKAGLDITVYSRPHYTKKAKKSYKYHGVKIINLPSINTKHLDAISHTFVASLHALTQNYDIIHYHGVGPSLLSWIPRIFAPRTKVISTFHCIDRNHQKWGHFAKLSLYIGEWSACRFPHRTISVSRALKQYCQIKFNQDVVYIPNGVKTKPVKNAEKILAQYGLAKGGYIISVCRLVRHKGIHTLIKAYNKLHTNKKLVIVGGSSQTDDYVKELYELAKGNKNIIFTGEKSGNELTVLFKNAYLFAQPSESEGMSIALLESMAYGVPALVSDIAENREAIGDCGLEFKNKSISDLAQQLSFAFKHPRSMKQKAIEAKARAAKCYDWTDITKETSMVYDEAIAESDAVRKAKKVMRVYQVNS